MTSTLATFATLFTLLAPGNGLTGNSATAAPAGVGVLPVIDVPAPQSWGTPDGRGGGQATRIELDDAALNDTMSVWYRLAYVAGGTRLRVFEHYNPTTRGPQSDTVQSEYTAWLLANQAIGQASTSVSTDQLPNWARFHTGIDIGPSGGLMFTLAYIDLLTPGKLVGNLRVAGTGAIGSDGVVIPVTGVEAKLAAAMLTRPDVVFTTRPSVSIENTTIVESHHTRILAAGYTIGTWLNVTGYEQAGRNAARHPGAVAVVEVHDIRQVLAWLCGRTNTTTSCTAAHITATIPIGTLQTDLG